MDSIFVRCERIVSRKLVDELMLVPVRHNVAEIDTLYALNEVGARIYELIDGKRTLREVGSIVAEDFQFSQTHALGEVSSFADRLIEIDAIRKA